VQVSAFPDRYQERDGEATALVGVVWAPIVTGPPLEEEMKYDIWQVAHNPGLNRQYAVAPGSVPVWLSQVDKATLAFFGWFNSLVPRKCELVQIDRLTDFAKKAR
jgi:hypothetical protein